MELQNDNLNSLPEQQPPQKNFFDKNKLPLVVACTPFLVNSFHSLADKELIVNSCRI